MSNYGEQFMPCPVCGALAESEAVDVGVGLIIRGNYACESCGWEIDGPDDHGMLDLDEIPSGPPEAFLP